LKGFELFAPKINSEEKSAENSELQSPKNPEMPNPEPKSAPYSGKTFFSETPYLAETP